MPFPCVPPVAASLIATAGNILHIAPVSTGWKADAPRNVVVIPPTLTKQTLLMQIGLLRPASIIVADQSIDADVIEHWRVARPFGELYLVRRGTSLDKVRLDLCTSNGIRVVNTPGVNAPHVAAYIAHWLTLPDGSIPREICVLGYGNVGKELISLLLERAPQVRIKVLVRQGRAPDDYDSRVSFLPDWFEALQSACAVAICLSLNNESAHRIDRALIQCLHKQARLVCVAKPDVFSDDALQALAVAEGIQLVMDYGPATLDGFRTRTQALGCCASTWRRPATLTTQASTGEACHRDLDYAVSVQLSVMALRGLVRRKLAHSLTIPRQCASASGPRVSIIGRGINGLLQAVMLRLANYQVVVYGCNQAGDGASHKQVNMRHLSATETAAKPLHNGYLFPANQCLAIECNRAGIELFEKLFADNPSLARYGTCGGDRVIEVSGHEVAFSQLKDEIEGLLQCSDVQFLAQELNKAEIAEMSRDHFVVTANDTGLSIVHCSAHHRIAAGGTYAGGTTQGMVWASLVQELIQANQNLAAK